MSNNNKRGIFAGKGYYIALILCAAAIGITGYAYYRSETQNITTQQVSPQDVPALLEEPDIPAIATEPRQEPSAPSATQTPGATTPQPTQPAAKKPLKTMAPVTGQEIACYSMEELSYNQTTRDWRVHNGVDLAAADGTPVCAAADGVVESAYEDDAMGYTVVIRHDGGYTTCYSSLAPELSVKSGDRVHMGQAIGCVGQSALLETTLGTHVHFSVTCQGKPMDPSEFLSLGK